MRGADAGDLVRVGAVTGPELARWIAEHPGSRLMRCWAGRVWRWALIDRHGTMITAPTVKDHLQVG